MLLLIDLHKTDNVRGEELPSEPVSLTHLYDSKILVTYKDPTAEREVYLIHREAEDNIFTREAIHTKETNPSRDMAGLFLPAKKSSYSEDDGLGNMVNMSVYFVLTDENKVDMVKEQDGTHIRKFTI
jgi:hypothetical protein